MLIAIRTKLSRQSVLGPWVQGYEGDLSFGPTCHDNHDILTW